MLGVEDILYTSDDQTQKVAMISGHTDLTKQQFDKYYVPEIDKYIKKGYSFLVGGASGCDTFAQNYLSQLPVEVTVCDKGDQNNCLFPDNFYHINGFASYPERDNYMTQHSSVDIAWIYYGSAGSGTCANLLRRKLGDRIARQVINLLRKRQIV